MTDPLPPEGGAEGSTPLDESAPAVVVLRMMRKLITESRQNPTLKQSADVDLRVLNEIHQNLARNAADPGAVQWLRQLSLSWNSKLRGAHTLKFRRIFDLLDSTGVRRDAPRS